MASYNTMCVRTTVCFRVRYLRVAQKVIPTVEIKKSYKACQLTCSLFKFEYHRTFEQMTQSILSRKNTHDHGNFRATQRTPPSITDTRLAHASQKRACPHGTSAKPPRGATKQTSQKSSDAVASAAVVESDVIEVVATGTGSCWSSDGFTFLLSQVFRRVNWRFCDLYSAVIIRQGLLCSWSPLFNRAV